MKKPVCKIPNGTKVKNDTGCFTIIGYSEGFYICNYVSDVNPEYSQELASIREEDIKFLTHYK